MDANENNKNIRFLSIISYIGVLFVVGHFAVEKDNPDLRFHKYQGAVLFAVFAVLYAIVALLGWILSFVPPVQIILSFLLYLGLTFVYVWLMVLGIRSAARFEQGILPFVGNLAIQLRTAIDERRSKMN